MFLDGVRHQLGFNGGFRLSLDLEPGIIPRVADKPHEHASIPHSTRGPRGAKAVQCRDLLAGNLSTPDPPA
jgi:hypothetical protein